MIPTRPYRQIKAVIEPIYKVTPVGWMMEKREFVSTMKLINKLVEYQSAGGYTLEIVKANSKVSKVKFIINDERNFSYFVNSMMQAIDNVFTIRESVF